MSARKCFWVWLRLPAGQLLSFHLLRLCCCCMVLYQHGGTIPYHGGTTHRFRGDLESNSWRKNEFNLDPLPSGVVCVAIYSKPV